MIRKVVFLLCYFIPAVVFSQENFSVFLVGDGGQDTSSNQLLLFMKSELQRNTKSAVVFLGDNIYPKGFLEKKNKKHEVEKKKLSSQLDILKDYRGSAFFIPGNHDWRIGKMNGKKSVIQQGRFVDNWMTSNSKADNKADGVFFPKNGESGPVSFLLSAKLRLIVIDTQWWLHPFEADKYEKNFFLMRLDSVLALAAGNGERVIVAAHHPLFSNGRHSKNRAVSRILVTYTPLQVFGLLGLNRLFVQDLPHPKYKKMRDSFFKIFEKYPGIIYAAGHDHNLQFFAPGKGGGAAPASGSEDRTNNTDDYFIVSGSGSKLTPLEKTKTMAEFSNDKCLGFFRIDFLENGKFILSAYGITEGKPTKLYSAIF